MLKIKPTGGSSEVIPRNSNPVKRPREEVIDGNCLFSSEEVVRSRTSSEKIWFSHSVIQPFRNSFIALASCKHFASMF